MILTPEQLTEILTPGLIKVHDCAIESAAQVAEIHNATDVAAAIRRLKQAP